MKRTPTILCLLANLVGSVAFAQGTFNFATTPKALQQSKIVDIWRAPITGTNYWIDVVVRNPATGSYEGNLSRLTAAGDVPFTPTHPLAGAGAGLFFGGSVRVPFLAPGSPADALLRVWFGTSPTYEGETFARSSFRFTIGALGGTGAPPSAPVNISDFQGMILDFSNTAGLRDLPARIVRNGTNIFLTWPQAPPPATFDGGHAYLISFADRDTGALPWTNRIQFIYPGGVEMNTSLFLTPTTTPTLVNGQFTVPLNVDNASSRFFQVFLGVKY